jgi:quinol monooxygenase YgiN
MIHVIAILTTLPGKRSQVLEEFKKLVPLVHAEEGCIEYQPVIDTPDVGPFQTELGADSYMVIEKWETLADLEAHSKADHMMAYAAKMGALMAGRQIHVLSNA